MSRASDWNLENLPYLQIYQAKLIREISRKKMADNIILIGFMGVGTGRTARSLASKTGKYAVDTDDLIESMINMKIRKIFAQHGEPFFRNLEQQTADWLRIHVHNTIVSTGGGFFMVNKMGKKDTVVYLHASVESILETIRLHPKAKKKIKKRPLLQDIAAARNLFEERLPRYRKAADLEVNVEGLDSEEVAEMIIEKLRLKRKPDVKKS